jgi:hypothetical protein
MAPASARVNVKFIEAKELLGGIIIKAANEVEAVAEYEASPVATRT